MKIFDPNGPMMIALGKLADIVICNMMFCLFSLPVVTIGASLTALFACMQNLIYENDEKEEGLIFRDFWRAFKQNFGQATVIWLLCLLVFGFFYLYYYVTRSLVGATGRVYQITFYLLLFVFLCGFIYLFPLQARFVNKVRHTIRNAWLLSLAALPWTLLALALPILAVYISFFMRPDSYHAALFIWAVAGFGVVAYLDSFFFRMAFRKLGPEQIKKESKLAEGAVFVDEEHRTEDLMVSESRYSDPNWNRREDIVGPDTPKKEKRRRR